MRKNIQNIIGLSCLAFFMSVFIVNLPADDREKKRDQPSPRRPEAGQERRKNAERERDHGNENAENMEKKMRHLREAAENLELAGLADEAHKFRAAAEKMQGEIHRQHEAGRNDHHPPAEMVEKIHHLQRQVEEMRKVLHQQQEQIEALRKQVNSK